MFGYKTKGDHFERELSIALFTCVLFTRAESLYKEQFIIPKESHLFP